MYQQSLEAITESENRICMKSLTSLEYWPFEDCPFSALTFNGFGDPFEWVSIYDIKQIAAQPLIKLELKGNQFLSLPSDCACMYAVEKGSITLRSMDPVDAMNDALIPIVSQVIDEEFYFAETLILSSKRDPDFPKFEIPLDYHLGHLLGMAFESNTKHLDEVRLSLPPALHDYFIGDLVNVLEKLPEFKRDGSDLIAQCPVLSGLLVRQVGTKKLSHFPMALLTGPQEFREGFLDGLLENRICIPNDHKLNVEFSTMNRQLAYEVKWLAASLGIGASIRSERKLFRVRFRNSGICHMGGDVKISTRRDMLKPFMPEDTRERGDIVPVSRKLAQSIKRMMKPNDRSGRASYHNAMSSGFITRAMAFYAIKHWSEQILNEPDGREWKLLVEDERINWSRIVSVDHYPAEAVLLPAFEDAIKNWITVDGVLLAPAPDIELITKIGDKSYY